MPELPFLPVSWRSSAGHEVTILGRLALRPVGQIDQGRDLVAGRGMGSSRGHCVLHARRKSNAVLGVLQVH